MSRVTIAIAETRRYLDEYNVKDVNTAQILFHLNQAQGDIAMIEDCIEAKIQITLVDGQAEYDYLFDDGAAGKDIIKRVKSVQFPNTWNKPIFPTDQEFDEMKSSYDTIGGVQYIIIRNGKIEFFDTPGSDDDTEDVTLQCFLFEPTLDANNDLTTPIDFQVPRYFDNALPMYAASFLLPLENPGKQLLMGMYKAEVGSKAGVFNHKTNYVKSAKPNW